MCTIAAGIATSLVGSLWGGYQQNQAASAQAAATQAQAQDQAQILNYNAAAARTDAQVIKDQQSDAIQQLYNQRSQIQGEQRVASGASGTVAGVGDALNIEIGTFETTEQDLSALRSNYSRQVNQYLNEADISEWQSENVLRGAQAQAAAIRSGARSNTISSLLTAGGTVASNWNNLFGRA